MTIDEAKERAREIAESSKLGPLEAAALASLAAHWAGLDGAALEERARESLASAESEPYTRLHGARQLLATLMREEAVIESLPEQARQPYLDAMHGFDQAVPDSGRTVEEVVAEFERAKAAAAQPDVKAAAIEELYKHPAMMDERHPEHAAVVQQLVELHED